MNCTDYFYTTFILLTNYIMQKCLLFFRKFIYNVIRPCTFRLRDTVQGRRAICLLCSRLFNLFYFKYFAKHKAYKRRAFYNYYLQNLTPCSFSYQAAPQKYQENHHNKSKTPLGQQTRGYYSCGKGYCTFAPCSTTVHRINSFSKAYSYFYITQQDLLCDN